MSRSWPLMTARPIPAPLAAACPQVRLASPGDAVSGVQPSYVAAPISVSEACAVMRAAAELGLAVLPRGTGTKLAWGAPPRDCDLIVETALLDAVLEHAAGDLVASVQAGVGVGQLATVLAPAGQRLAIDPPARRGGGTIGGLLATGTAGPLRLRYGTPRDLLIGITVVRADGVVTRSGGKVVKNVAGYDLGKLYTGSYGTLGLIVEATFRLHPLPTAVSFVLLDCEDPAAVQAALTTAVDSPLVPAAAEIDRPACGGPIQAGILLEGDKDSVARRASQLCELLGHGAEISALPPAWWGLGAPASADGTAIRIAFWAGQLAAVLDAIDAAAGAADLDTAVSGSGAAGVIYAAAQDDADPAAVVTFVTALRAALSADPIGANGGRSAKAAGQADPAADGPPSRASVVVLRAPAEVMGAIDMWGPVPSLGLMRSVKDQFDPDHRMAPGRFAGGI
jgi:glycolate dehydrogenase FAD-binding subunit